MLSRFLGKSLRCSRFRRRPVDCDRQNLACVVVNDRQQTYLCVANRRISAGDLPVQTRFEAFASIDKCASVREPVDLERDTMSAPGFTHEYAKALHRLNEWTKDEISFYGVKVEVIKRTGDSCSEPRFRKVVYPGGWDRDLTLPPGRPVPPYIQKYHDFFQPLIGELIRSDFADKAVQNFNHTDRCFPSRINRGVGYAATLEGNDAWVTLHIRTEDKQLTKRIFDELQAKQEDIENDFKSRIDAVPDPEWHWLRHDNRTFSSINIRRDGSIDDPPEKLEEIRAWMLDLLPKLKEVFDPRVANILSRSP